MSDELACDPGAERIDELVARVRELEAELRQCNMVVSGYAEELRNQPEEALRAENERLRDALDTLAKEEWRDDDDPVLKSARLKARAALAGEKP